MSSSGHRGDTVLRRACDEIFARWRRFLPENEAREQAELFRRRVETLTASAVLSEVELDATLELVADSMRELTCS